MVITKLYGMCDKWLYAGILMPKEFKVYHLKRPPPSLFKYVHWKFTLRLISSKYWHRKIAWGWKLQDTLCSWFYDMITCSSPFIEMLACPSYWSLHWSEVNSIWIAKLEVFTLSNEVKSTDKRILLRHSPKYLVVGTMEPTMCLFNKNVLHIKPFCHCLPDTNLTETRHIKSLCKHGMCFHAFFI